MLEKFPLPLPLLQPNLCIFLLYHAGICPWEGWTSANFVSRVGICQGQHSPGLFLGWSGHVWWLHRFQSLYRGWFAYCQMHRWSRLLLGRLVFGDRFRNGTFVHGWMSNLLLKRDTKRMNVLCHHDALIYLLIYSLPHWLFKDVLLTFHIFVNIPIFLLLFISSFLPLMSELIICYDFSLPNSSNY